MDLQKAYDSLDWYRYLEILAVYGVGPRTVRLLRTYWDRLTVVTSSVGYFLLPFKGYPGITQGNPLSPTLLNMVMDAVICHWVMVVAPTEEGMEVLGLLI